MTAYPASMTAPDTRARRAAVAERLSAEGLDALVATPGADMAYLLDHWAHPSERPQLLIISRTGRSAIVLAGFEARALPALDDDVAVLTYSETTDPYDLAVSQTGLGTAGRIAVSDPMWSRILLYLMERLPRATFTAASALLAALRMRKDEAELARLREAAVRADSVWPILFQSPLAGRTESEVASGLRRLLEDAGLRQTSAIVAGGPNGASPHHRPGERVIQSGEMVVLDYGGTFNGYWADITRTVAVGKPSAEMALVHETVSRAQQAGYEAVAAGRSCESVDGAARSVVQDAGFGDTFIHRTGHGIGLDGHEEPYIVAGNNMRLEPAMTFSVEPGIYLAGKFGVRIEDIVVVTAAGAERLNQLPRALQFVE
ncbi:MAG TPA: aminopeptidase P family protein [Chloroflexota bacterium]|nr:aminopeptidase P family protein [Chloroflexota bacterium]